MTKVPKTAVSENTQLDLSEYPFGYTINDNEIIFRFFSPKSRKVILELFDNYEQKASERFEMQQNDDIWELVLEGELCGKWYGYRIFPPEELNSSFMMTDELIADPYSRYVTSKNHYKQFAKTLILPPDDYNWEGDSFVVPEDPRDLIIYEAHIKDMTAHSSSKTNGNGAYLGFIDANQTGGINHLKRLGINAVEFLPLQKFANFEPPYLSVTLEDSLNTWNYYGRNYWGYMTSYFLAPETIYASDSNTKINSVIGKSTKARKEFKDVVKNLHSEGISVIMDVVYNHVSQYDLNPLKYAGKEYYFRLNGKNDFQSNSGCGNDLKSESPYAKQLIIDSIKHWMNEYHIDGFRFDLALVLDWQTIEEIRDEARKINPNVLLIAEPWHLSGYDPTGFSARDWSAWNDKIRNGVKGSSPHTSTGFIFGDWHPGISHGDLENFLCGTVFNPPVANLQSGGNFNSSRHSVNYLACHDNLTLGDFIRIALNHELEDQRFDDKKKITPLHDEEMKISRLAAVYLFVSQGITMIHEGQEWARSKIIAKSPVNDPRTGYIDPNSYEKDNETNYLNFDEIEWNKSLFEYYRGLIALRKKSPALRKSNPENIHFYQTDDALLITFYVNGENSSDPYDYIVSLNGNRTRYFQVNLPEGAWELVVSQENASDNTISVVQGSYTITSSSGFVFRRLRQ